MSTEAPSLFAEITAAGIPYGSHESDLYLPDTPQVREILARHPQDDRNKQFFTNEAGTNKGQRWIDVPFAYLPFWETKQRRA